MSSNSYTEQFDVIPEKPDQPLKPLTPPSPIGIKIRQWQANNPIAFIIAIPFVVVILLIITVWTLIMHRRVAAIIHVIIPLTAITGLSQTYLVLICVARSIIFEITNQFIFYPSNTRRILSFILSAIETELLLRLDSFISNSSSVTNCTILSLITCWTMFLGELWVWTSERHLEHTERKFLSLKMRTATKIVEIAQISTLIVDPDHQQSSKPVLVCCHGYGAGKAFYGSSLDALSAHYQVYCIDWLGFGRSSRRNRLHDATVEGTEKYFVDSLEQWRVAMGFEKFHLLGHSMGGYLCAVYAMQYPDRIQHLFLISPVGLPDVKTTTQIQSTLIWKILMRLWNWGITPIALWRLVGPFGPAVSRYGCWLRYGSFMTRAESDAIADYIYHLNAGPLVGDIAISRLLHMGAWPRLPLGPRLTRLRSVPLTFMYGTSDWMDRAYASVIAGDRKRYPDSGHCRIYIVPDAGHQIFVMNPTAFSKAVLYDAFNVGVDDFKTVSDDDIVHLIARQQQEEN